MALDKVKQGVIADDAVGSSQIAPDTVVAADIGANAITASELADNAVDTAAIASNAVTTAKITDANITAAKLNTDVTDGSAIATEVKPHIIPGVLQPAVAGKLLDGTTSHSGDYGTAQSDGRKYYYTDIKGSKPIKDPRIGGHFGSQRHKFKSIQLLEQETATHGKNVYSIDGREWIKGCGTVITANDGSGDRPYIKDAASPFSFIEITGYFSDINIICLTDNANGRSFTTTIDGGTASAENTSFETSTGSPLESRYVDAGSVVNLGLGATLGIHTLKITAFSTEEYPNFYGIELITQDLSGSGSPNRSKIKFPLQNVVSYGKKFPISETNHHYNPFAFAENGTTAVAIGNSGSHGKLTGGWASGGSSTADHYDSTLDTSTSLGLDAWVNSGNYYRPVNGGRVVKWVDSSGNIKTSVNMMPPTSICPITPNGSAGMEQSNDILPTGTNWTSVYQPVFGGGQKVGNQLLQGTWSEDGTHGFETDGSQTAGNNTTATIIGNGTAWVNTGSNYGILSTPFTTVEGRYYKVEVTNVNISSNTLVKIMADTSAGGNTQLDATLVNGQDATYVIKADSDLDTISIQAGSGTVTITRLDVAVYEIEDPSIQSEVAKTFHWREFGNGGANAGTGSSSDAKPYADSSMLSATDDNAFVMDDGLTSLSAKESERATISGASGDDVFRLGGYSKYCYLTFIGTGISFPETYGWNASEANNETTQFSKQVVQNLPYGTHIIELKRESGDNANDGHVKIDGISVLTNVQNPLFSQISIHQPKRPPIPEDACVLADYMLMADLVKQTAATAGHISKGTRFLSSSRDFFYDAAGAWTGEFSHPAQGTGGHDVNRDANDATAKVELPFFGTNFISEGYQGRFVSKLNDSALSNVSELTGAWVSKKVGDGTTLGLHKAGVHPETNNLLFFASMAIATPIHTAHHYQSFETPYLHELIGGDRNMEQTNLVVSPDGKTWDEVTRDTSYIGIARVFTSDDESNWNTNKDFKYWRGGIPSTSNQAFNKDFAISYDRIICLVDGQYKILYSTQNHMDGSGDSNGELRINGTVVALIRHTGNSSANAHYSGVASVIANLKRGDTVETHGERSMANAYGHLEIHKI